MNTIVYNNKGGVGKTTIATHLFRMQIGDRSCCLLDLDEQQDAMRLLSGHEWEGQTPVIQLRQQGAKTASIATCDIKQAKRFDHRIIDTPPRADVIEALSEHMSLSSSDLVIIPIRGRLSMEGALRVIDDLEPIDCRVVLVINRTEPREDVSREEIAAAKHLGVELYPKVIPRAAMIREAELTGKAAWEMKWARNTNAIPQLHLFCYWVTRGVLSAGDVFDYTRAQQQRLHRFQI